MKSFFNRFTQNKWLADIMLVLAILVIFTGVFYYWGNQKTLYFCDEIYTYILSNSDNEFLTLQLEGGRWYDGSEIQEILSAREFDFDQVKLNNMGDVHPPIYYFVFHILSVLNSGSISKWIGLAANWIFVAVSLVLIFAWIRSVTKSRLWALAACLVYISSPAVLSNVMLIRMYGMFSMWAIMFAFVSHCLETEGEQSKIKRVCLYVALAATTFFGFLTQYYFAVFCALFTFFYCLKRLIKKQWKEIFMYLGSLVMAVAAATYYWRTWFDHMFSGYLGGAVTQNAFNFSKLFDSLKYGCVHLFTLMYNRLGIVMAIVLVAVVVVLIVKKDKRVWNVVSMLLTAVLYSIVVVHLTPAHLLGYRYFFPIVGIAYLALYLGLYYVADIFLEGKKVCVAAGLLIVLAALNFVRPMYDRSSVMYTDNDGSYAEFMELLESISDMPWVYYGYENSVMACLMYDATMVDEFIMVNEITPFTDERFTQNDCEFILFTGNDNLYAGEVVYDSMEKWFAGEVEFEQLIYKDPLTVYRFRHTVNEK